MTVSAQRYPVQFWLILSTMGGKAVSGFTLTLEFSWFPLEKTNRMKSIQLISYYGKTPRGLGGSPRSFIDIIQHTCNNNQYRCIDYFHGVKELTSTPQSHWVEDRVGNVCQMSGFVLK